jgi:hypothetical protein
VEQKPFRRDALRIDVLVRSMEAIAATKLSRT